MKPTKEQVAKFIDVFHKLSEFEATHRLIRSWGLFNEDTDKLPIPDVMKVMNWLKKEFDLEVKEHKDFENSCSSYSEDKRVCIDTEKPCDYCFKN